MKWFLIVSVGLLCSAGWVRGDAAAELYNQGADALAAEHWDVAAQAFDKILNGYPNTPNIDDVHLRAGFAYLHLGKFPEAVDRLAKETAPNASPAFRGTALYFTGLAYFSQGQKTTVKADSDKAYSQAAATLTTLIDYINTTPTPDNKDYLEDAIYYRALAQYQRADYTDAEKDLLQLLSPQFGNSLKRPDYYLLLGSLYAVQTNQAVNDMNDEIKKATAARKSPDEIAALEAKGHDKIKALANKAILNAFDKVSTDPNALVQANDANMSKAEVLYLIAQLEAPAMEGYQKALDEFRLVRRKDDMVQLQQTRLNDLKKASEEQLRNAPGAGAGAGFANANSRLIEREEQRLDELKSGPDPIILALIRIAECYNVMHQSDEARTVLRRLQAHADLTADQQQEVDFQLLYSYVLGGQTDKADKALTDYLGKHPADPQADGISYLIAAKLLDKKDYGGALQEAQRSLNEFPNGRSVPQAILLEASALTGLGKTVESEKVIDDYVAKNPKSPVANQMLLTKARNEAVQKDFKAALADYQKVKDNNDAADLQPIAAAGYIQTLQAVQRYDDVIKEAKAFAAKYPASPALPGVMVYAGLAMDQKHDPAAVAALQAVARKYPKDDAAPFALFYVVNIYQRAGNVPAMIQAANDLRAAYPTAYTFLAQAADAVGAAYLKDKNFDQAIATYQPLADAPKPDVAAVARNKIGAVWLEAAKAMGAYQSMQPPTRLEAEKRLASAEEAYLGTLKTYPEQTDAVGDAFQGLTDDLKQRRSWGLLTDANMEASLAKLGTGFTNHDMQTRFEMAQAGLVFVYKNGEKQYPAALERFKKAIDANPGMVLTRQEADQFGELLLAAQDYERAGKVYQDLLDRALPNDELAQADGLYGLGAIYLAQGNVAQAKEYFSKMEALPGGALWHPHILDADYGLALADEQSTQPADNEQARQIYAKLMQAAQGGITLQAKAMLGYGRLLEKAGHTLAPAAPGSIEYAIHYYQEVNTLFGPAVPVQSAEGLYDAGQAYQKAGDKVNARKQYDDLLKNYRTTAPDWAARTQAAEAKP